MADDPDVISTVKARGGATPHVVRYVLIASLALAVIAMAWVFLAAPATPPQEAAVTQSPQ